MVPAIAVRRSILMARLLVPGGVSSLPMPADDEDEGWKVGKTLRRQPRACQAARRAMPSKVT
jgi:hypothetical protein